MLASTRRLRTSTQFTQTVRAGKKAASRTLVMYRVASENPARFGFIVSGTIGNAVKRNRVKRQLRHIAARTEGSGDIVVRALPPAQSANFSQLANDFTHCWEIVTQ